MKGVTAAVALLLFLPVEASAGTAPAHPAASGADSLSIPTPLQGLPVLEAPDTVRVEASRSGAGAPGAPGTPSLTRRQVKLLFPGLGPSSAAASLTPPPGRLLAPPVAVRLTRFGCAAYGADRGASTALWIGGVGHMLGFLSEKDALRLTAAGAVLGALWGGTAGAEDTGFRVRVH
jgi:hypothetical protein